jgi:hypothetical protein
MQLNNELENVATSPHEIEEIVHVLNYFLSSQQLFVAKNRIPFVSAQGETFTFENQYIKFNAESTRFNGNEVCHSAFTQGTNFTIQDYMSVYKPTSNFLRTPSTQLL